MMIMKPGQLVSEWGSFGEARENGEVRCGIAGARRGGGRMKHVMEAGERGHRVRFRVLVRHRRGQSAFLVSHMDLFISIPCRYNLYLLLKA